MCIEDMSIGRHVYVRGRSLNTGVGETDLPRDVRRVGVRALGTQGVDPLVVSVWDESAGAWRPVWAGFFAPPAAVEPNGSVGFRADLMVDGQIVTGLLRFENAGGVVSIVELLADDELDQRINDHWDRMWRVKGG